MTEHAAPPDIALIGGTGVYDWPGLEDVIELTASTPWGAPSGAVRLGTWRGLRLAFLARHGADHHIAPHAVNYRANLWALHDLGARRVLGINAVGGITAACAPTTMVLPDQLIDYTWGRPCTFHAGDAPVPHAEFAEPYSGRWRARLVDAARDASVALVDGGCYGATQGPRLETRAEIARLCRDGCDLVGMTGMPEAALARELALEYACLALVGNWAAGCGDEAAISIEEVRANVAQASAGLHALIAELA